MRWVDALKIGIRYLYESYALFVDTYKCILLRDVGRMQWQSLPLGYHLDQGAQ